MLLGLFRSYFDLVFFLFLCLDLFGVGLDLFESVWILVDLLGLF